MITANRLHKFVSSFPSSVCAVCSKELENKNYPVESSSVECPVCQNSMDAHMESPQETEQCPRCYSAVRYVRLWISGFTGNCTNPWHDSPEYTTRFEEWLKQDYPDIAERSNNTFRSAAKAMEAAWNAALAGRKD